MRNRTLYLLLILLSCLMAACAPMSPAPTGESRPLPSASEPRTPRTEEVPAKTSSPTRSTEEESGASGAVHALLERGWTLYGQGDYQSALGLAERAQRIDARSPEVYLLMASAQFSLYRLNIAEQLTRKGLALSAGGSPVNRQLQSLLGRITAAAN